MSSLVYHVCVASVALAVAAAKKETIPFELYDFSTGNNSGVERPFHALVTTEAEWQPVWEGHKGLATFGDVVNADGTPPAVNFKTSNVIAFFAGPTVNVAGYAIHNIDLGSKQTTIQIVAVPLPTSDGVLVQPYAMFEVSKASNPIELQLADGKGGWKTVAKFEAPRKRD